MPGKSEPTLAAIRSSSGTRVDPPSSPIGRKRPQELLRHLHPGEDLGVLLGVAQARPRGSARGSRCRGTGRPRPITSGVSAGNTWRSNSRPSSSRSAGEASATGRMRTPCSSSSARRPLKQALSRSALLDHALVDRGDDLGCGSCPSAPRASRPASIVVLEVRDPDHEELVQVRLPDRAELDALEQRDRVVLGELEDAVVELEPRELAVEVELRGLRSGAATAASVAPRSRDASSSSVSLVVSVGSIRATDGSPRDRVRP